MEVSGKGETMKLVDADRVLNHVRFLQMYDGHDKNSALRSLENYVDYYLPDAIIRCKDCKHHMYENGRIPYCYIQDYGYGWQDDDFCSRGERKTNETD